LEFVIQKHNSPRQDRLFDIELLEIGELTYQFADNLAELPEGEPQPLEEWVTLIGTAELQALGAPDAWLS
jgi:hypothetical protein